MVPTTTLAVVLGIVGTLVLAVIVAFPPARLVTWNDTKAWPPGIKTEAGTVATTVLLELRFTVNPLAGAAADSETDAVCVLDGTIPMLVGLIASVAPTFTIAPLEVSPAAEAVIVTDP
jgi:hypothetical protein